MRKTSVLIAVTLLFSLFVVAPGVLVRSGELLGKVKAGKVNFEGTSNYLIDLGKRYETKYSYHLGLDLQGGSLLSYEIDTSGLETADKAAAVESLRGVIDSRINSFGVSEPLIFTTKRAGKDFLVVELPGISNIEEAIDLIGKTAVLEFKIENPEAGPEELDPSTRYISNDPPLTGKNLKRATQGFGQANEAIVSIDFDDDGSKIFADMTRESSGKTIAIFLDDEIISAPQVSSEITGGNAQISGGFTVATASSLAIQLNAGALPAPIKLAENRTIGATLGTEAVNRSLFAGIVGIAAVMIFMTAYYRLPGLIASIALAFYILISLALFRGMLSFLLPFTPVTLTLAGIAGFILSVGIAVDANVLIFERMKEELRAGKRFELALTEGFSRAWNSIRDSSVSSLITTIILFSFGTGIIRGFAVTLTLGILVSLFSAITITKAMLRFVTSHEWGKKPWLYGFKFKEKEL